MVQPYWTPYVYRLKPAMFIAVQSHHLPRSLPLGWQKALLRPGRAEIFPRRVVFGPFVAGAHRGKGGGIDRTNMWP